jgi:hypothetical protein
MRWWAELAELLDVDVDEFTGMFTLGAPNRFGDSGP